MPNRGEFHMVILHHTHCGITRLVGDPALLMPARRLPSTLQCSEPIPQCRVTGLSPAWSMTWRPGSWRWWYHRRRSVLTERARSVEAALPIGRHLARGSGRRLIFRMPARFRQRFTVNHLASRIVVKPGFPRLETCRYGMPGGMEVFRGMLIRRTVATADVAAFGATSQVQPPATCRKTFDAAVAARRHIRIDSITLGFHGIPLSLRALRQQQYFTGAALGKSRVRVRCIPKREPACNRDCQLSLRYRLNHVIQIPCVLFGHKSDRAHPRILG